MLKSSKGLSSGAETQASPEETNFLNTNVKFSFCASYAGSWFLFPPSQIVFQLTSELVNILDQKDYSTTHSFRYESIIKIRIDPQNETSFFVDISSDDKLISYNYTSICRSELLSRLYECMGQCDQCLVRERFQGFNSGYYKARRMRKKGSQSECRLSVRPFGIVEMDITSNKILQVYYFYNIIECTRIDESCVLHFTVSDRIKIFVLENDFELPLIAKDFECFYSEISCSSINIIESNESFQQLLLRRNAICNLVACGGPICTFDVTKFTHRYNRPMTRQVQLNEEYLIEKDSSGFQTVSYRPLCTIFCCVRSWKNQREFSIEYDDGSNRFYSCASRDNFLAVLLDICHAMGNVRVVANSEKGGRRRLIPRNSNLSNVSHLALGIGLNGILFGSINEMNCIEKSLLTRIAVLTSDAVIVSKFNFQSIFTICLELNSNIAYPGISTKADQYLVQSCLSGLLQSINFLLVMRNCDELLDNSRELALLLQTLYRIVSCVQGYKGFLEVKGIHSRLLLIQLLKIDDSFVNYWTIEILSILCCCPFSPRNSAQEYTNKRTLMTEEMVCCIMDLICDRDAINHGDFDKNEKSKERNSLISPNKNVLFKTRQKLSNNLQNSNNTGSTTYSGGRFGPNPLVTMAVSTLLESIVSSRKDTSSPELVASILDELGRRCIMVLHMLRTISFVVLENAAILMFILLKHRPDIAPILKEIALCEGLALKHFYSAVFSPYSTQRYISRFLVSSWMSGSEVVDNGKSLLCRIIPRGLVDFLNSPILSEQQRNNLDKIEDEYYDHSVKRSGPISSGDGISGFAKNITKNAELQRRMRTRISSVLKEKFVKNNNSTHAKLNTSTTSDDLSETLNTSDNTLNDIEYNSIENNRGNDFIPSMCIQDAESLIYKQKSNQENWRMLFHIITQNHRVPDLIWNEQTRLELRSELEQELRNYEREKRLRSSTDVAWNFQQFKIVYPSLKDEMQVGHIYVRHFLEADDTFLLSIEHPSHNELFEKLFRRVVGHIGLDTTMSTLCVRCLVRLYSVCQEKIGPFDDMMLVVDLLDQAHDLELQHVLLLFLEQLSENEENLLQLLDISFVDVIIKYASLAHLNPEQIGNLLTRGTKLENKIVHLEDMGRRGSCASYDGYNDDMGCTWRDSYDPDMTFEALKENDDMMNGFTEGEEFNVADTVIQNENRSLWVPEDTNCPQIWYVIPKGSIVPPSPQVQRGPHRISELIDMYDKGDINAEFIVAPALGMNDDQFNKSSHGNFNEKFDCIVDTGRWKPIGDYFQLRMQILFAGKAIYSPAEISAKTLELLARVSIVHKAYDARGLPFYPIPVSRRIMSEPEHLAIISQLLLSNDLKVVENASNLLCNLVEFNPAVKSKLYLTGLFFFACRYSGNNFKAVAKLLDVTHLKQSNHIMSSQVGRELHPAQKSVLSSMLSDAIINILAFYGAEKFAEVYTGEFDTPEVIWNSNLRLHVIEMIEQHLGTFPAQLRQFTLGKYEYCPIPTIHFPDLEKEMYVNKYYLRNLCNEEQFPNWYIDEPLLLLRDVVERWRIEMAKSIPDQEILNSKRVLELDESVFDATTLRKAYRSLARRYHPDRNPSGREMFEKIQLAYELLSNVDMKEVDTDMISVLLLLKTQNLVYRRYPLKVQDQKYPAFSLLESVTILPDYPIRLTEKYTEARFRQQKSKSKRRSVGINRDGNPELDIIGANGASVYLIHECCMLAYHACTISPLNSRELVRTNMHTKLYQILSFALDGISKCNDKNFLFTSDDSTRLKELFFKMCRTLIEYSIKSFASLAFTDTGRDSIMELCPAFSETIFTVLHMHEELPFAVDGAIQLISRSCTLQALQTEFIDVGCVWLLVPMLLNYDPQIEDVGEINIEYSIDSVNFDMNNSAILESANSHCSLTKEWQSSTQEGRYNQSCYNMQAALAAIALGRLGGFTFNKCAEHRNCKAALEKLLTPALAKLLRNNRPDELLAVLNGNIESPTKIWNVGMRQELLNFLSKTLNEHKSCSNSDNLLPAKSFSFSCLQDELCVNDVYVRVFNNSAGDIGQIDDSSHFAHDLMLYICSYTEINRFSKDSALHEKQSVEPEVEELSPNIMSEFGDTIRDEKSVRFYVTENSTKSSAIRARHLDLAVEALRILVGVLDHISTDIISFPRGIRGLFGIMSKRYISSHSQAFFSGAKLLEALSAHSSFISTAASKTFFPDRFCILQMLFCACQAADESTGSTIWRVAHQFSAISDGLEAFLECGVVLRLLGCIFGVRGYASFYKNREDASLLLSKLLLHPIKGAETARILQQFLPIPVVQLLRSQGGNANTGVKLLDGHTETPEVIWTKEMKLELRDALSQLLNNKLVAQLSAEHNGDFGVANTTPEKLSNDFLNIGIGGIPNTLSMPESFKLPQLKSEYSVPFRCLKEEFTVGNVYLIHFLKQPTFRLANPIYTLEMVNENWESTFKRLIPKKIKLSSDQTGNFIRESLMSITAAALPFLRESINPEPSNNKETKKSNELPEYFDNETIGQGKESNNLKVSENANISDTQLLLYLTQAIGSIIRAEPSALDHLVNWGLTSSLVSFFRKAVSYRTKLFFQYQNLVAQKDPNSQSQLLLSEQRNYNSTIAITCSIDLLNLLVIRTDVVDDLASISDTFILCLKDSLSNSQSTIDASISNTISSLNNDNGSIFAKALPSYTSAVLKLLVQIFRTDMSMNLLVFVEAAVSCNLCDFLLHFIICAPIACFESMNVQVSGTKSASNNRTAHTVRAQAADVIKAILVVDEEEYYTVALRHLLENHPVWRGDFGYQSHNLYSTVDSKIEPLLLLADSTDVDFKAKAKVNALNSNSDNKDLIETLQAYMEYDQSSDIDITTGLNSIKKEADSPIYMTTVLIHESPISQSSISEDDSRNTSSLNPFDISDTDEADTPEIHKISSRDRNSCVNIKRKQPNPIDLVDNDHVSQKEFKHNERYSLLEHNARMEQKQQTLVQVNNTRLSLDGPKMLINNSKFDDGSKSNRIPSNNNTSNFSTTITKGAYGVGLDLCKSSEGKTEFVKFKSVSGPNLAKKCSPALKKGDLIVAGTCMLFTLLYIFHSYLSVLSGTSESQPLSSYLLSHPTVALASHITIILTCTLQLPSSLPLPCS